MGASDQIYAFVGGLPERVRTEVLLRKPATIEEAYDIALMFDTSFKKNFRESYSPANKHSFERRHEDKANKASLKTIQATEKPKEQKCWICESKEHISRGCPVLLAVKENHKANQKTQ